MTILSNLFQGYIVFRHVDVHNLFNQSSKDWHLGFLLIFLLQVQNIQVKNLVYMLFHIDGVYFWGKFLEAALLGQVKG